ncbi:hypothetical protein [Geothermobacter hydrogeniphilus]|uniref:Uncharacterized protein n=1 Tax=Geothermobacter hydrogeniphilus TaxID=1969733 RepID=A0A1X0YEM0_9BACT|nr:hypothetical protein [Geothermobacter hydrogeniphilus]ORJ63586.1 hypothetical protein B5V00_01585 [Geothermobacter hydrogeniphilus]
MHDWKTDHNSLDSGKPESSELITGELRNSLTCLRFPKITGEPMGAPQIFENRIQAKLLHSPSGINPLIQVKKKMRPGLIFFSAAY